MSNPLLFDEPNDRLLFLSSLKLERAAFVKRLPSNPDEVASFSYCEPFDRFFLNNSALRFFEIRTPKSLSITFTTASKKSAFS
jgi:hypothetical protein